MRDALSLSHTWAPTVRRRESTGPLSKLLAWFGEGERKGQFYSQLCKTGITLGLWQLYLVPTGPTNSLRIRGNSHWCVSYRRYTRGSSCLQGCRWGFGR